ncbi:MAG: hypothetical protein K2Q22_06915, partial [Cytophagales bacterium]|nr:hypothetical protein [Cytophagales bacterium]
MAKIVIMGHIDGYGGAQTAFRKLVEFLSFEGHDIRAILITDYPNSTYDERRVIGVIRHRAFKIQKVWKIIQLIQTGLRLRMFNPELFISVGLSSSSNFLSHFLKDSSFTLGQDFIANRSVNDRLYFESFSALNAIVVQSPSMLNGLPRFDPSKTNWLPCFPNKPIEGVFKSTSINDHVRFCYFGRLASNKGLNLVIRSFNESEKLKEVSLDIWGTGKEKEYLVSLTNNRALNSMSDTDLLNIR